MLQNSLYFKNVDSVAFIIPAAWPGCLKINCLPTLPFLLFIPALYFTFSQNQHDANEAGAINST